jgi:hypothetical protein
MLFQKRVVRTKFDIYVFIVIKEQLVFFLHIPLMIIKPTWF